MKPSTRSQLPAGTSSPIRISRRRFLGDAAVASAAFQIVPGHVLGLQGATSPNEKLNIAGIGFGGQGAEDLKHVSGENIVALCDVDWAYAAPVFKKYPLARQHRDYRKMLEEQKEIDAVVVATPDHIHAFASMAAIKLGKHVYCEKPLTHTAWEARQLARAAREHNVATQMGNQGQASDETRHLCELIWSDAIGPVREVHIWTDRPSNGLFDIYWPQGVDRPKDSPPAPDTLDWDLWLGPAPHRPYHPAYLPFKWRGWWDFGTGALGDMGCHSFDPVFRALKLSHPVSVEASSTHVNDESYPLASMVTYHFAARSAETQPINPHIKSLTGAGAGGVAMPPLKLVWYDGGLRPPRPEELEEDRRMGPNGALLIGDRGKILHQERGYRLVPQAKETELGNAPKTLPRSTGHYQEWIDACKGGQPGGSNFDWAGPLTEAVLLGNVALRLGMREELTNKKLLWDPVGFKFTNSERANQFLRREYRHGWTLG
jgi:predicted dehydrogenase